MAREVRPSQSAVLRERSARVPWRRVFGEAIRDRAGTGRTVLPDRLEGAVYGQLVADSVGPATGSGAATRPGATDGHPTPGDPPPAATWSDASARTLGILDALLGARLGPDDDAASLAAAWRASRPAPAAGPIEEPSPAGVLPVALVMRERPPGEIVDVAASVSDAGGRGRVACALYALMVRMLVTGERARGGVLDRATRQLRAALTSDGLGGSAATVPAHALDALDALDAPTAGSWPTRGDPSLEGLRQGWEAFTRSAGYEDAVIRALAAGPGSRIPAAIAGGLAGARWGSSAIPQAWRRRLPDGARVRSLVDRLIEAEAPAWDGRPWQTSSGNPLRVDLLDLSGLEGRAGGSVGGSVGITFLPGRRYVGYHTGAHWRDLEADAARLRELGVGTLLLLVEDRELARCRVAGIGEALAAHDVDLVRFPIRDPLLPRDGVAFRGTIASLLERLRDGGSLAIACRGGLDRAGMAAACLLREAGLGADEAIRRVQSARIGALTLPDQQAYVRDWPPQR